MRGTGSVRPLAAVLLVALAAGCTSSGGDPAPRSSGRSVPATGAVHSSSPSGALPSGVVGATGVPTKVANNTALRSDVDLASCTARTGGWKASGTVHNPKARAHRYKLTVFFTTDSATVIGVASASVRVPGRTSRPWTAAATFHAAKPTLCVLRGVS